jgi:quinol monooxygenase YgiN
MSNNTITVVATFEARAGKEAELKQALLGLLAPTRKEAGCINYDLHVSPENPTKFLFHENWTSRALLDAHSKSPHLAALHSRLGELCVTSPEVKIWEKIG